MPEISLTPEQHELAGALQVLLQRLPSTYALQIASVPVLPGELADIMTAALAAPVREAVPLNLPRNLEPADAPLMVMDPDRMGMMVVPAPVRVPPSGLVRNARCRS